ncbi:MAG: RpiB/LacA/LacB family sugar-phosphate isomerase [Candidatus Woesearchaeota archaeon]|nr:MAG: RpiB/LacA/LacB family sugar-phosphate isomerase [Candidatus Woesearchaeota archaeon]
MAKRIVLTSDHAGFRLKEFLKKDLIEKGYVVVDDNPVLEEGDDYPDRVFSAAPKVKHDQGIFVCGTGIGMCIAANKEKGIIAADCSMPKEAHLARAHNNANVLCLGARLLTRDQAKRIMYTFLKTSFEGGRHARRVEKLA